MEDVVVAEGGTKEISVTLAGGDVDNNGIVDIADLVAASAVFNTDYAWADINGDNFVDIYDLALVGLNFAEIGGP